MSQAYQNLVDRFRQIYHLHHLKKIISWDMATLMPAGGIIARSKALAELDVVLHGLVTSPDVSDWIQETKQWDLEPDVKISLREMERVWLKESALSEPLIKAKALAASKCEYQWRQQRLDNDWKGFSHNLKDVVQLVREEAETRAEKTGKTLYDALLDVHEPDTTTQQLDSVFENMKGWLPDFIQQAKDKQQSDNILMPRGEFPMANQKALGLEVMNILGFDFNHGRIDASVHPFCGGVSEDVRMTTRYNKSNFVESLTGFIHETGHARYQQNLPQITSNLPVGCHRSMGIHEGQSLFFEMQLGRSPAFLSLLQPMIIKHLSVGQPEDLFRLDNLIKIYSRVRSGLIRVDADEITYPAHIILRYEIERELIERRIEVNDIPELWNLKMQDYLGVNPGHDQDNGCMQDIHWSMATFGYFPSYTLGAMYAAQLFAAVNKSYPDVHDRIAKGDLQFIFDWLDSNIWSHDCYYQTSELITKATGENLNPAYFKSHLQKRYLE